MGNVDRLLATAAGGLCLLACGACSQPWKLTRAEPVIHSTTLDDTWAPVTPGSPEGSGGWPVEGPPPAPGKLSPPWDQTQVSRASYELRSRRPSELPAENEDGSNVCEQPGGPFLDLPTGPSDLPAEPGVGARLRGELAEGWRRVLSDHRNYYGCRSMRDLWLGVAGGAVLANTSLDDDFQGWYQRDVRSPGTDHFADFWKAFGQGQIFIPAYAGLAVTTEFFGDRPLMGEVNEFSERVIRGCLVGVPPMLLMQALLGSSRPGEDSLGSQWRPFHDSNGVSGHAFIGAVPFITAARMCDRPLLKATFYTLSTFPAWSRVNDNAHYLSQVGLAWWMAYLACRAVDDTEHQGRNLTFTPLVTPEVAGVAVEYRR